MPARVEIRVLNSPAELFRAAAEEFSKRAEAAVQHHGNFTVALSGGSTPRGLNEVLAGSDFASLPWDKILFFWGDERHVPPDHGDSNYRMSQESLLSKVPVRQQNIFRIRAEDPDATRAAVDYERVITRIFGLQQGEFPRFDLILLGIGTEGHTASLFPGSAAMGEEVRLVVSNWVEKLQTERITLTFPVLNHAACVMFLASGREKADIVQKILGDSTEVLPAKMVQPFDGDLVWFLDKAARP